MSPGRFRFDRFLLDAGNRRLLRDGDPVEVSSRYFDALKLLVLEQGRLVSKERFLDEVWRGVPVTDEALTQCMRTLRRQLGDDAARPRFIETVPKHGYRFISPVETVNQEQSPFSSSGSTRSFSLRVFVVIGGAGTLGGGVAGVFGGLLYGFGGASPPGQQDVGATSVLLVLVCLNILVGLVGGAGVGFGIAAAESVSKRSLSWMVGGGAFGGLVVGALAKLAGLDAFNLLFGRSPGDITGAAEGALLGGALGLGAWLGSRGTSAQSMRRSIAAAALTGGGAGLVIPLLGGRLMGGSLELLTRRFPDSRLRLDQVGALFGESGFGPFSQTVTSGVEGLLFGACVVGAMVMARRARGDSTS
jgi:DNA-binding winged helix-turn-helix (wHTH) protein